jgi:NAD(P)-dependent dehydrogenase (short-subunit alcohol dehydrogenase family)
MPGSAATNRLSEMSAEDFREVVEVDLVGSFLCTKAVWDGMRAQCYGRILMTSSAAGLYGNFGESNAGAAKMGVIGLMNSLAIEGARNNVRVNAIAPLAATRMITEIIPFHRAAEMTPEAWCPRRSIWSARTRLTG